MSQQAMMNVTATAQQRVDLEADERSTAPRLAWLKNWADADADVHVTVKETVTDEEAWDLLSDGCADTDHNMDGLEGVVAFARVKAFMIKNLSASKSVTLKPGISNGWIAMFKDNVTIEPLGVAAFAAPVAGAIVDATHRAFRLMTPASEDSVDVEMIIIGVKV